MDEVGSLRGCVQTFTIGRSVVRVLGGKRCGEVSLMGRNIVCCCSG